MDPPTVPVSVCASGDISASPVGYVLGPWPGMVREVWTVSSLSLCHMQCGVRMLRRRATPLALVHIGLYMFWHQISTGLSVGCERE